MSTVAVVGLGYVGLPLAVAFGKNFRTIGFDLSAEKVGNYRRYVTTDVVDHWSTVKRAYRVTLEDGTEIASSPFVTEG